MTNSSGYKSLTPCVSAIQVRIPQMRLTKNVTLYLYVHRATA